MYFASAPRAIDAIAILIQEHNPKIIALDCSAIPNFEYTALEEFSDFENKLRSSGITLWLTSLNREAFETVQGEELQS